MKSTPIEYRNKTEPPTEPGWYYARIRGRAGSEVRPYRIANIGFGSQTPLAVWEPGRTGSLSIGDLDFFGPVRIVKEG